MLGSALLNTLTETSPICARHWAKLNKVVVDWTFLLASLMYIVFLLKFTFSLWALSIHLKVFHPRSMEPLLTARRATEVRGWTARDSFLFNLFSWLFSFLKSRAEQKITFFFLLQRFKCKNKSISWRWQTSLMSSQCY